MFSRLARYLVLRLSILIALGLVAVASTYAATIAPESSSTKLRHNSPLFQTGSDLESVNKNGIDLDLRSHGRQLADEVAANGALVTDEEVSPVPGETVVPQVQLRGGNVQVNDPGLDNIQIFAGTRPFVSFTQSETSIAAFENNIVATYNTSANQPIVHTTPSLLFAHRFLSGFSVSNDRGKTWTSGFFPPVKGSIFTFGDPSVDVDRAGNFYFATLGVDAVGNGTVQVNKSTDGGRTWSDAVVVQQDDGSDKEWMAVGRDPIIDTQDNVYVTWTSFQLTGTQIRFGRSTDGGVTWTSKTIFAPAKDPNPNHPQNSLQFTNPYVDHITGRLYIPFARFSNGDTDFLQILVSDDAGETFSFINFNVPGAPDPTLLPVVQPGHLIDCGTSGGRRLTIHSGADQGGGRGGLPRYPNASRLTVQPAFAARNGVLYMAWANSTSSIFGDLTSHSNILFVRSDDGGQTWTTPGPVNPSVASDAQHVLPALAIDNDPNDVHVLYYTQHSDGTVDVDLANSHDRGDTFPSDRTVRVTSTPFPLAPTNVVVTGFTTTNYDRLIRPCYMLGEYTSVRSANGTVYTLWGDGRNAVKEPANTFIPLLSNLTHPQADVFFQIVKAQ